MAWPTAQAVVQQAALELGLIQSVAELGDDVYAVTDSNLVQLVALFNKAGTDLVDEATWSQLRQEFSIHTVTGTFPTDQVQRVGTYVLPPDWRSMINQANWNRTNRMPMGGPLSEQEWQYLASGMTGVVWTVLFKPRQGLLWLYPATSTPIDQALTFAYKSSYWARPAALALDVDYKAWQEDTDYDVGAVVIGQYSSGDPFQTNLYRCVQPGHSGYGGATAGPDPQLSATGVPTLSGAIYDGQAATGGAYWNWIGTITRTVDPLGAATISTPSFGTKTEPTRGSDVVLFEKSVLVAKLKSLWLDAKGFDTTSAEREYQRLLPISSENDEGARKLSLNGGGATSDRLLGLANVPFTNFGS